jgi:hypothetical protein
VSANKWLGLFVVGCMTALAYASITAGQWIMAWGYVFFGLIILLLLLFLDSIKQF